ncbi:MAG TPA: PQQ-dependent sugar dehydrogenase, partial [Pirellulales bacterium]|nr:PQQ-dependent sugar dehydrogenase [Pirellulales bacterium]
KPGDKQLPDGTRLSRFRVSKTNPPRCDPASEQILLTWLGGGHNGGSLKFGPDGFLYISTGDGANPTPPDPLDTGQDISDLLSSILRIDVDHPSGDRLYSIPPDNPFVGQKGARGEVWAYGLRNPWRMSFDRETGDLWVGDVGWELWEMIYRIKKGGNYGWSIMEGPQPVHPDGKRGPTPIISPNLQFAHTEAASIIGGYVYRGKRLKDLVGTYICGDWETRRVWGTRFDGDRVVTHRELASEGPRIVAFGESHDGELYIVDYDLGTIHELAPNPATKEAAHKFPTKLSETGLFTDVATHKIAAGVVPFSIAAAPWADHATAERFVALPDISSVELHREPVEIPGSMFHQQFVFPKDGVLVKTISMEMNAGNPASRRRLETQLLHYDGRNWRGYSYRWSDDEKDATLVGATGQDRLLVVEDAKAPGGKRVQTWHYPGRNECMVCHNPWTENRLSFNLPQLSAAGELLRLEKPAVIKRVDDPPAKAGDPSEPALVNPHDASADLDRRARSYLQVNCAHCHQFGAGGTAEIELRSKIPLAETKLLVPPKQGAFGIRDAQIVAPGDPYRSVLYFRVAKMGHGRMPHIGSELVDEAAVKLLHDWIEQLPGQSTASSSAGHDAESLIERLIALDDSEGHSAGSSKEDAALRARERATLIERLLSSTSSALVLQQQLSTTTFPYSLRDQVVSAAYAHPDVSVRDLFERFVPPEKRVKRLGNIIDREKLLAKKGNADRGQTLFLTSVVQCKNCHRIGDDGGKVGPELTHVAQKLNRAQLLDKVLDPSKSVDPKFVAYVVQTKDGKSFQGILTSKTDRETVLRDVNDKEIRIPTSEIEQLIKQSRSLMPDQLLRDLTAEQAADLLAFLQSLK